MARRSSFLKTINTMAARQEREIQRKYQEHERELVQRQSEADRLAREAERAKQQAARTADKAAKEAEKAAKQAAKQAKEKYLLELAQNAAYRNAQLVERIDELRSILEHALTVGDRISFDSFRPSFDFPPFSPPDNLRHPIPEPRREDFLTEVKKPSGLSGILGIGRYAYEEALERAEAKYREQLRISKAAEEARKAELALLQTEHEARQRAMRDEAERDNQEITKLAIAYEADDPHAIVAYNAMVLEHSEYPEGFPQEFRLAFLPEPGELVVEYELPTVDVIPVVSEYRLVKSKETVEEVARKMSEIKDLYQDIVAAVALRTIHEAFQADRNSHLALVTFNGFVATTDPATGRDVRPCLISVRVTQERFSDLNLTRVDKRACLRNLGASVSPRPTEIQAVKPIVEFDMVDKRFVDQSDVLSDLESRPNLMELDPFEFENLVSNLFGAMGLDTKLTRPSRDGGVDCVAFDTRPVLGGKVVIQAKRYSNTVGVSAVRDLYGTMINEGANKGILVATSSYGSNAYDFAKDKPIELIDGGGLLYLLEQHGVKARIVFPNET